jgi:hypothetical protein
MWTGLLVGLLAAIGLLAVGVGAYHAGERHSEPVAAVVPGGTAVVPGGTAVVPGGTATTPDGSVVRVVGWDHWRGGPPFGFLFPLLFIGLIVVLIAGRRRAYWGRPWGPGYCGPGWGGPGDRDRMLADWHDKAHNADPNAPPAGA